METRAYSLKETAEVLGISESTVRLMLRDRRILGVKIGKHWRVSQAEMDRLLTHGTNGKA